MDNTNGIDIGLGSLKVEGDATKLFEALAKAQAEFEAVPRDSAGQIGTNRSFKYADYATLTKCTRPSLTKNGIVLLQPLHYENGMAVTTTIIAGHGARIESSFSFKADPNPQEFGRHHTYYRRYQLQGILGLEGEDADDARQENQKREQSSFTEPAAKPEPKPAGKAKASPTVVSESTTAAEKTAPSAEKPAAEPKPATNGKPDNRPVNARIIDGMKQLSWKMDDLKAFYKEAIDKKGFDKADNLPVDVKEKLYNLLVEQKGVIPF